MKYIILFFLSFSGLSPNTTFAQNDSTVTLPTVTITSIKKVDERVSKAFKYSFPKATNSRWYRINKDYMVKFIKEDMKHQTLFQKNGYIKYDISYGMAHDLTEEMGELILSVYKGYAITNVTKVTRYNQEFWIINLEGLSDFVVIRVENGDLEEVSHFEKWESY